MFDYLKLSGSLFFILYVFAFSNSAQTLNENKSIEENVRESFSDRSLQTADNAKRNVVVENEFQEQLKKLSGKLKHRKVRNQSRQTIGNCGAATKLSASNTASRHLIRAILPDRNNLTFTGAIYIYSAFAPDAFSAQKTTSATSICSACRRWLFSRKTKSSIGRLFPLPLRRTSSRQSAKRLTASAFSRLILSLSFSPRTV